MKNLDNIKAYVARAVIFKKEFDSLKEINDKYSKFTFLFPTIEDKMICKAIFDFKFTSEINARTFIKNIIDQLNSLSSLSVISLLDLYNQVIVLLEKKQIKIEKLADADGERNGEKVVQEKSKYDGKKGVDAFFVNNDDPLREFRAQEIKKKVNGNRSIEQIKLSEIEAERKLMQQQIQKALKNSESNNKEEQEKLEKYKKSLAERIERKEFRQFSPEFESMLKKDID